MKYIRTKNGVYETIGKEQPCRNGEIEVFCTKHNSVAKSCIINQANTIEELCDEFIVFGDIDRPYLTRHKFTNKEWNKQYFIGDRKLYGAIWTDKGLIYVAKMNDKGELELL